MHSHPISPSEKGTSHFQPSTVNESLPEFDHQIEARILRKLDFTVVPVLWFLFLVSFVDRGNIGNAKIAGMEKSLKLRGSDYNTAVWVFTLAYVVFAIPANLIFKRTGPKSLAVMIFLWGIFVVGQGVTKSYEGLVACRFFEGMCEAGFVPGAAYLIGSYYKRNEFLRRYTFFFGAAIIAGAFNGLLANVLSRMHGVGGYEGWRWIFIIEGCFTVLVSIISFFTIVPFPEQCKFLKPEEKEVLLARLKADGADVKHDRIDILEALKDWKIWVATLVYFGAEENASSVVNFQPTILKGLGYTSAAAQIHTIPVYATAFVFSMTCAILADRFRQRYVFGMIGALLSTIGLAVEIAQPKQAGVRYMGMFFLCTGPYIMMPTVLVWLAINLGKGYKRNIGLGALVGLGNCGAFVSSNVFLTRETPPFRTGFRVGLGLNSLSALCMTIMYIGLRLKNRRRDRMAKDRPPAMLEESSSPDDTDEKHWNFRYEL